MACEVNINDPTRGNPHPNYDRIKGTEDFIDTYKDLVNKYVQGPQKKTFAGMTQEANDLLSSGKYTARNLLEFKDGDALNEAQTMAARSIASGSIQQVYDTMKAMENGDPVKPNQLLTQAAMAAALNERLAQARATTGRTLGFMRASAGPANAAVLGQVSKFAQLVHEQMTEPQMFKLLQRVDKLGGPIKTAQFLENYFKDFKATGTPFWQAAYYGAMLQDPSTFVAAAGGSMAMTGLSFTAKAFGEVLNRAIFQDKSAFAPGESAVRAHAMWDTLMDQARLYGRAMSTKDGWGDMKFQAELYGEKPKPVGTPFNPETPLQNMFAVPMDIYRYGNWILGFKRTLFRAMNERAEGTAIAYRHAMEEGLDPSDTAFHAKMNDYRNHPSVDDIAEVRRTGDHVTLTQNLESQIYRTVHGLYADQSGGLEQSGTGAVSAAMRLGVDPFFRVMANMASQGLQHTPLLGMLSKTWQAEYRAGGASMQEALGKQATGTMMVGLGYYAAAHGLITGPGPDNPKEKANWEKTGWAPYSVMNPATGKPIFSFKTLPVVGPLLGLAAEYHEIADAYSQKGGDPTDLLYPIALAHYHALTTVGSQAFTRTFTDLFNSLFEWNKDDASGQAGWEKKLESMAEAWAPSALRAGTRVVDPEKHLTSLDRDLTQHHQVLAEVKLLFDRLKANQGGLLGYSKEAPPFRDVITGKPEIRPGGGSLFGARYAPEMQEENDVDKAMRSLQMNREGAPFAISRPSQYLGGRSPFEQSQGSVKTDPRDAYSGVKMNDWDQDQLIKLMQRGPKGGPTMFQEMLDYVHSDQFKQDAKTAPGAPWESLAAKQLNAIYQRRELYARQQIQVNEDGTPSELGQLVAQKRLQKIQNLGVR